MLHNYLAFGTRIGYSLSRRKHLSTVLQPLGGKHVLTQMGGILEIFGICRV